jgi:hypothetical protein
MRNGTERLQRHGLSKEKISIESPVSVHSVLKTPSMAHVYGIAG